MLRHGSPRWLLWLFGAGCVPLGLWLWHGQGSRFGLGSAEGRVSAAATYATAIIFALLLVLAFAAEGGP